MVDSVDEITEVLSRKLRSRQKLSLTVLFSIELSHEDSFEHWNGAHDAACWGKV
jgi:hypothetical protein